MGEVKSGVGEAEQARRDGVRLNWGSRLVLEALQGEAPLDAYEIFCAIRDRGTRIARATVYRNLADLAEQGLVQAVEYLDGRRRYAIARAEASIELVNLTTGVVAHIDDGELVQAIQARLPPAVRVGGRIRIEVQAAE